MTIFLDKLLANKDNKYLFTKAAMSAIEKKGNIKDYPEEDEGKLVSNILNLILDNKVKYSVENEETEEKP